MSNGEIGLFFWLVIWYLFVQLLTFGSGCATGVLWPCITKCVPFTSDPVKISIFRSCCHIHWIMATPLMNSYEKRVLEASGLSTRNCGNSLIPLNRANKCAVLIYRECAHVQYTHVWARRHTRMLYAVYVHAYIHIRTYTRVRKTRTQQ